MHYSFKSFRETWQYRYSIYLDTSVFSPVLHSTVKTHAVFMKQTSREKEFERCVLMGAHSSSRVSLMMLWGRSQYLPIYF